MQSCVFVFPRSLFHSATRKCELFIPLLHSSKSGREKHPEIHNTEAIPPKRSLTWHPETGTVSHNLTGLIIIQYRGSIHRIPGTDRGVTIQAGNLQLGVSTQTIHFCLLADVTHQNETESAQSYVTFTGCFFIYFHASTSTRASLRSVMDGSLPVSTNNNTASATQAPPG